MCKPIQVLLVDDHDRPRRGMKALLATCADVELAGEAKNGRQAIQRIEELQPDVVLMDAQMPVMDGATATRIIKERWPKIRVVILTMYAVHQQEVQQAGADIFLVKGCPLEEILAAVMCTPDDT